MAVMLEVVEWGTPQPTPKPGGTVYVGPQTLDRDEATWCASWQNGPGVDARNGPRSEVIEWARTLPADSIVIRRDEDGVFIPLEGTD